LVAVLITDTVFVSTAVGEVGVLCQANACREGIKRQKVAIDPKMRGFMVSANRADRDRGRAWGRASSASAKKLNPSLLSTVNVACPDLANGILRPSRLIAPNGSMPRAGEIEHNRDTRAAVNITVLCRRALSCAARPSRPHHCFSLLLSRNVFVRAAPAPSRTITRSNPSRRAGSHDLHDIAPLMLVR